METHLEESDEEVLSFAVARLRETFSSLAPEIILPFAVEYPAEGVVQTVPKAGEKKKLLELSEKKCRLFPGRAAKEEDPPIAGQDPGRAQKGPRSAHGRPPAV